MSESSDAEDLAYFQKNLFAALKIPKKYLGYEPPTATDDPNPLCVDDDFYVGRWRGLDEDAVTRVFPKAVAMSRDVPEEPWTHTFKDAVGHSHFIVEEDGGKVASHGSHVLSPDQHRLLVEAGAEFY